MKKAWLAVLLFLFCPVFLLAANKVNINTASLAQLDLLTGVGPAIGQRIIDARPYSSLDDLLRVKGIGEATLQKIKNQGLAYVVEQVLPKSEKIDNTKAVAPSNPFIADIKDASSANPWFLFFTAAGFVGILGAVAIFIKFKNHVRS